MHTKIYVKATKAVTVHIRGESKQVQLEYMGRTIRDQKEKRITIARKDAKGQWGNIALKTQSTKNQRRNG